MISKVFLPGRLFLGIAVALAGVGLLVAAFVAFRPTLRILGFGALLVAIGIGVAFSSNAEACAACRKALQNTSTALPIDHDAAVVIAVQMASRNIDNLVALCNAPFPVTNAPLRASMKIRFCPGCMAVAQIQSMKEKPLPDGAQIEQDLSAPALVTGPGVKRLLDAIGVRNSAWAKVMYGG
jgi:hypothetical protein